MEEDNCEGCAVLRAIINATLDTLRAGDDERVDAAAARVMRELDSVAPPAPALDVEAVRGVVEERGRLREALASAIAFKLTDRYNAFRAGPVIGVAGDIQEQYGVGEWAIIDALAGDRGVSIGGVYRWASVDACREAIRALASDPTRLAALVAGAQQGEGAGGETGRR